MEKTAHQLELLLPELSFPGRDTVAPGEIASKVGLSLRQIHILIEDPDCPLIALNTSTSSRGWYRVPVTAYYAWLIRCLTGTPSENPILSLDTPALLSLYRQIRTRLEIRGVDQKTLAK